jgi:hypothetical protein
MFERMPEMPAGLADKIRAQIERETGPVKPLMSGRVFGALVLAVALAVSLLLAAIFKFKGVQALTAAAGAELLVVLLIAAWLAAVTVARSMRPAGGVLRSWLIGGLVLLAYEGLVVMWFHDYSLGLFVERGVKCFGLGTLCGILVAVPVVLLVRRGFVVEPVKAGAGIGLLGGLAGVIFLTLHCDVLEAPHAAFWHALVLVFCAGFGALVGYFRPLPGGRGSVRS